MVTFLSSAVEMHVAPFTFREKMWKREKTENIWTVSSLQMKHKTSSQCDNVYTVFQQHTLDELTD